MQPVKEAAAAAKEAAANIGASAKSGMDKTKATIQEKVEKVTAQHPAEKEMAERQKQERIREAEVRKQEAMEQNGAAREEVRAGHHPKPTSAIPGHGTGEPAGGYVESGVVESQPIARETGTGRPSAAHNPRLGSEHPTSHGTGGAYT